MLRPRAEPGHGREPRLRAVQGEGAPPPHNLDAEAALLGAMLLTAPAVATAVELLDPEDFYLPAHACVFEAIVSLHEAGQPVDPTTVADRLARVGVLEDLGGKARLLELQAKTPAAAHAEHYAALVGEAALRRRMLALAFEAAELTKDGQLKPEAILGQTRESLDRLVQRQARLARSGCISLAELMATRLPKPRWVVPGYLPEGLSLLAGRPKIGKSWLALNLAIAVGTGGRALGALQVEAGEVLYLALEDTLSRLQRRTATVLAGEPIPRGVDVMMTCPRLDEGGHQRIEAWLQDHPDARLVIVDTLAKVRPRQRVNGNLYAEDYAALAPLKHLADEHKLAVLAVHHLRKGAIDDPIEAVSGTAALTGAADSALILRRDRARADAVLYVTGRDIEEAEVAITLDQARGAWMLLGDADEYRRSEARAEIIELLRAEGEPLGAKEVAEALGKPPATVRWLLAEMVRAGQLVKARRGRYALPGKE